MAMFLLIGMLLALVLAGFFSGIEVAFLSANKIPIELKRKQGVRSGRILAEFMESPAKFIGTTLVGLVLSTVLYGLLIGEFLTPAWRRAETFLIKEAANYLEYIRLLFDTVLASTILLLVTFSFRSLFKAQNDTLLGFFAPVIDFFYRLLFPVASYFVSMAEWVLKYLFNVRMSDKKEVFSRTDLEQFMQQNNEQEESNELNTELFENALSLPNIRIRQCLVPRKEVVAVDINIGISQLQATFVDTKLSKLVVYEGNIDNIQGYVHQLGLFSHPGDIKSILLPIPAVPESMSATDLISKFTRERKSIAWVVDEFGGTSGIITMEDLLEEVFGEIKDEYDVEEFVEKQIAEKEYMFSGRLELDYLNDKYGFHFPITDSETLSGYIINSHESIPKQRDRIFINDCEFEVLNVSETRIETVKVKILK